MPPMVQKGNRFRVINTGSPHHGRYGLVGTPALEDGDSRGGTDSRQWNVAFDYPLGGLVGRAVLGEDEMETVSGNMDPREMFQG
jgi:hypothetical protein